MISTGFPCQGGNLSTSYYQLKLSCSARIYATHVQKHSRNPSQMETYGDTMKAAFDCVDCSAGYATETHHQRVAARLLFPMVGPVYASRTCNDGIGRDTSKDDTHLPRRRHTLSSRVTPETGAIVQRTACKAGW